MYWAFSFCWCYLTRCYWHWNRRWHWKVSQFLMFLKSIWSINFCSDEQNEWCYNNKQSLQLHFKVFFIALYLCIHFSKLSSIGLLGYKIKMRWEFLFLWEWRRMSNQEKIYIFNCFSIWLIPFNSPDIGCLVTTQWRGE